MHHVKLDAVYVVELAVEGDVLHRQQPAQHLDRLAHGQQGLAPVNAHLLRQRIPPRADAADDAVGGQVV